MKKKILSIMLIVLLIASVFTGCSCEHQYTTSITKEATCAETGELTKTCAKCGQVVKEEIPKAESHNFGYKGEIIKEATCSEDGEKKYTCSVCGAVKTETIQKGSHKYIEKIEQKSTCTENGKKTLTCSLCGYSATETIKSVGHKYTEKITKKATCSTNGEKIKTCSECGHSTKETIVSNGHKWESATCTKPKTCSTCKATTGSALGHTCTVGKCSRCNQKVDPQITLLTKTPATCAYIRYGDDVVSKIKISEVSLYFEDGNMKMSFVAEKVYDYEGASGTNIAGFKYIVKDADGFVVETGKWLDDLKVGDKVKEDSTLVYRFEFTEISESYTVEFTDLQ